jgi:hypothetical protein
MPDLTSLTELLARKTGRRGLLGRSAELATGALIGAAAGELTRGAALAGGPTVCSMPGTACPCYACNTSTGACRKPCVFSLIGYASGCWVTVGVTCCDCACPGLPFFGICGCATDYHAENCPV